MAPVLQKCINNPFLGSCLKKHVCQSTGLCLYTVCCGIAINQNVLLQWVDASHHGLPLQCLVPFKYVVPDKTKYISWWLLSNRRPNLTRTSKILVKLTSIASRLKSYDFNLKGRPLSEKLCSNCNHGNVKDVRHIISMPFESKRNCRNLIY